MGGGRGGREHVERGVRARGVGRGASTRRGEGWGAGARGRTTRLEAVDVERREELPHLRLADGAHAQHGVVGRLEKDAPLVKVDALCADGRAHVGDGEGDDRLGEVVVRLLLPRGGHGEDR